LHFKITLLLIFFLQAEARAKVLSDKAIIIATSDLQIDFFLPYYTFLKKKRYRVLLQTPPKKRPDEHRVI
jgi:hypothetical protein